MSARIQTLFIFLAIFQLPRVFACSVPVFRYAMESWPPANYEMYVFHRTPLKDDEKALLESYRRAAEDVKTPVNIAITTVDLSSKMDDHIQQIWEANKSDTLPKAVIVFPESNDAIWSGSLSAELPRSLAVSPARTEISKRLANGESAVFVLLEGNDAKQNAAAAELLEKELAGLQAALKLPQQDDADEHLPRRHKINLPLRLSFSILRVSRSDEKESAFAKILTKTDKKLSAAQPVVLPIFGRGRVLCAMSGPAITATGLADCATFVAGACSCQVKELNPGVDMLMAVNWDELIDAAVERAAKNPQPETTKNTEKVTAPASKIVTPPTVLPKLEETRSPVEVEKESGSRKILWFAIAGAVVLVILTGRAALKSGKAEA